MYTQVMYMYTCIFKPYHQIIEPYHQIISSYHVIISPYHHAHHIISSESMYIDKNTSFFLGSGIDFYRPKTFGNPFIFQQIAYIRKY